MGASLRPVCWLPADHGSVKLVTVELRGSDILTLDHSRMSIT